MAIGYIYKTTNLVNVKYGLVKGFYKEMIFESISKKEYLSTLKEGGQFMGRPT